MSSLLGTLAAARFSFIFPCTVPVRTNFNEPVTPERIAEIMDKVVEDFGPEGELPIDDDDPIWTLISEPKFEPMGWWNHDGYY